MKIIFTAFTFCLISTNIISQKINDKYQYHIKKAIGTIKIDGKADEEEWKRCQIAGDFWMITPADTSRAIGKTEARFTYDEKYLYYVSENYQQTQAPYIVESLKRDFNFGKNDNIWLILEPFNDLTNAWVFGANAAGAQFDGQIAEGTVLNPNWDNRWISQTSFDGVKWTLEMAIPFNSLRYKAGEKNWGMNISRLDLGSNEKSSWAPVPRQFFSITLAYTGSIVWDTPPPAPKTNISIIPYALAGINRNFETGKSNAFRKDVGVDAKIALTPSLNLDLTLNPDFSQVDVDQQVTNFNRFELFFPERRQFFLENSDIFNSFGDDGNRPFFSRRIGLGTQIQYGARLSGKLDNNWRIGALNMQTSGNNDTTIALPTYNYSVFAVQRKVFSRSNIAFMMVNKDGIAFENINEKKGYNRYNRNLVLQYNLASKSNKWSGKLALMKSFTPNLVNDDYTRLVNIIYATQAWTIGLNYTRVGENFRSEVGFVPQRGYTNYESSLAYTFYPKKSGSHVVSHGPRIFGFANSNNRINVPLDVSLSSDNFETVALSYNLNFRDRTSLTAWTSYDHNILFSKFNPVNPYSREFYLKNRSENSWRAFGTEFSSTPKNLLTFGFNSRYGGYYGDGTRLRLNTQVGYRIQPFFGLNLSAEYNKIADVKVFNGKNDLPAVGGTDFWLIQSKFDVTFTNKFFWTTYLQYNKQIDNVNLNSRIQWRYKPASDIFLVYSDNFLAEDLKIKNRSIVLKWNYWWNI